MDLSTDWRRNSALSSEGMKRHPCFGCPASTGGRRRCFLQSNFGCFSASGITDAADYAAGQPNRIIGTSTDAGATGGCFLSGECGHLSRWDLGFRCIILPGSANSKWDSEVMFEEWIKNKHRKLAE